MQTLVNFLQQNKDKLKLRNLDLSEINESLRNLEKTKHFIDRKNAESDNEKKLNIGFKNYEIFEIVDKCSDKIETMLLNNSNTVNNTKFKICIIKHEGKGCLVTCGIVTYWNKNNFEYDFKPITAERYANQKFTPYKTDFLKLEIINNRVREIN